MEDDTQMNEKFYRKAERDPSSCCGKGTWNLRFQRIQNSIVTQGFCAALCKVFQLRKHPNLGVPTDQEQLEKVLPIREPDFKNGPDTIKYTWIGHSSAVISFGEDIKIMIDPVFSERASPVSFAGPKRFRRPAATLQQLPKIDAIFISHDHYDHLDSESLEFFYKKNPETIFFAGLDSEDAFPKGCKIKTLDWTEECDFQLKEKKFKVTFVPVCHWGRRGVADQNKRLWGGFVIETQTHKKIFYSGDTAYCEVFKELGTEFGGFDLAILPIGAYEPRQFLMSQHVNPKQAVLIHKELNAKKSVGVHWGTFPLGFQHFTAAREDLQKAKQEENLKQDEFITVDHGGSFTIDYN